MKTSIRDLVFRLSKSLGLFRAARRLTGSRLRILCYHGFAYGDENEFRPNLFMSRETFERRMSLLHRLAYPVLPLDEALFRLRHGDLPAGSTVITIDDGFASVRDLAWPRLRSLGFPATLYVSTYFVVHREPVFRLLVQYLFWKTKLSSVRLGPDLLPTGIGHVDLGSPATYSAPMWDIIGRGEREAHGEARRRLIDSLIEALGIDDLPSNWLAGFFLMDSQDLARSVAEGLDIQLHTHRHSWPLDDRTEALEELRRNQRQLDEITGSRAVHFCYPSGIWSSDQWPWLQEFGVESATTCDTGLNTSRTPRYGLKRILDGDQRSDLWFEAELSGFASIMRILKRTTPSG